MKAIQTLLILFFTTASHAQSFSSITHIDGGSPVHSRSPEIHAANGKVYVAYYAGVLNIRLTRSLDGGLTFQPAVTVSEGVASNNWNMMLQRSPKFAIDPSGVIHLTWTEDRRMKQGDVWYVRSLDDGLTWSQPVSISGAADSMKYFQDFASIASDSSGTLYASFLDFQEEARGTSDNTQLYLTKSTNGGDSWSEPVRISKYANGIGGTCECCKQEIAVGATGNVYVAYRSNVANNRDIYVARSMDRGETWENAIKIADESWMIMACPTQGPDIALDNLENLHITWRDSRNQMIAAGKTRVYYDKLGFGAAAASMDLEVTPAADQGSWPAIVLVPQMTGVERPEIYYQSSTLNGAIKRRVLNGSNWATAEPVTTRMSGSELVRVARGGAMVHAVWQESETGTNDMGDINYVRSGSSMGVLAPDGRAIQVYRNGQQLSIVGLDAGSFAIRIGDVLGRTVARFDVETTSDLRIPLGALAAGAYWVDLIKAEARYLLKFIVE